jgi:hypothetical protein
MDPSVDAGTPAVIFDAHGVDVMHAICIPSLAAALKERVRADEFFRVPLGR